MMSDKHKDQTAATRTPGEWYIKSDEYHDGCYIGTIEDGKGNFIDAYASEEKHQRELTHDVLTRLNAYDEMVEVLKCCQDIITSEGPPYETLDNLLQSLNELPTQDTPEKESD